MNSLRFACLLLISTASFARAQLAADSAQNYPVTAGGGIWNNGDNMGFGFQPWQFATTGSAGMFLGDSTQNGGGGTGNPGSSDGINSPNSRAWGLFAFPSGSPLAPGTATAIRPFDTALVPGETFRVDFDNGFCDAGGSVGISLASSSGSLLWQFAFTTGETTYHIFDHNHAVSTSLPITDGGMHIEFTLNNTLGYSATITLNSGPSQTITGQLVSFGSIGRFEVFNQNAGAGPGRNVYANNLSISAVPEPSTFGLLAVGAGTVVAFLRRKS